jgi:hypothetical protein
MKNIDYLSKLLDDFDSANREAQERRRDASQAERLEIERFAEL